MARRKRGHGARGHGARGHGVRGGDGGSPPIQDAPTITGALFEVVTGDGSQDGTVTISGTNFVSVSGVTAITLTGAGGATAVDQDDAGVTVTNSTIIISATAHGLGVDVGDVQGVTVTANGQSVSSAVDDDDVPVSPIVQRYRGILNETTPDLLFAMNGLKLLEWEGVPIYYADAAGTTPIVDAGDPIGGMLDLVSGTIKATQTVDGSRPILGVDGVELDGIGQRFSGPNPLGTDARTVICAATAATLHTGCFVGTREDSNGGWEARTLGSGSIQAFQSTGGGSLSASAYTPDAPFVASSKFDTTNGHWLRVAGFPAETSPEVIETSPSGKFFIGALSYGPAGNPRDPFDGKITTVVAWTIALTTPEITNVEGLLS